MTDFLNDAIKRIEDAGFCSTVGHRYFTDLAKFPTGSVPQFHYYAANPYTVGKYLGYADPPQIRGRRLFSSNPKPFLGEFASAQDRKHGNHWPEPELRGKDTTVGRFQILESEGCDLAMIWPDLDSNDPSVVDRDVIKLLDVTRREIATFTKGVLPPPDRRGP